MLIWRYGRKGQLLLLAFLDLFVGVQMVFLAFMISGFIAAATAGDLARFTHLALITAVGFTALSGINQVHVWVKNRLVKTVNLTIKAQLATTLLERAPLPADPTKPLSFMTNDLKLLETNGIQSELTIMENALTMCFAVAGSLTFDWLTTLVFIGGALLPMTVAGLTQKPIDRRSRRWSAANEAYTGQLKDLLTGLATIRSYHATPVAKTRLNQASSRLEASLCAMNDWVGSSEAWMTFIALTVSLLLPFGFGILRIIGGVLSLAGFIGIVQLSNSITNPLLTIMSSVNSWNTTRQLQAKLRAPQPALATAKAPAAAPLGAFAELTLRDVTLKRGDKPLLQHFNLQVHAGEKVLLKAPSGFGKSTLLLALQGQLPLAGDYRLNGRPVGTLAPGTVGDQFSLIQQAPFLFNDTLRFNLTLGGSFSDAATAAAAKRAQLWPLVQAKGWTQPVGAAGANLSGGQLQRVEIARAFLHQRPIILADEVTSALDETLSTQIHEALFAPGQTVIEVAHHLSADWTKRFDQVIDLTEFR